MLFVYKLQSYVLQLNIMQHFKTDVYNSHRCNRCNEDVIDFNVSHVTVSIHICIRRKVGNKLVNTQAIEFNLFLIFSYITYVYNVVIHLIQLRMYLCTCNSSLSKTEVKMNMMDHVVL